MRQRGANGTAEGRCCKQCHASGLLDMRLLDRPNGDHAYVCWSSRSTTGGPLGYRARGSVRRRLPDGLLLCPPRMNSKSPGADGHAHRPDGQRGRQQHHDSHPRSQQLGLRLRTLPLLLRVRSVALTVRSIIKADLALVQPVGDLGGKVAPLPTPSGTPECGQHASSHAASRRGRAAETREAGWFATLAGRFSRRLLRALTERLLAAN
jgi:hypothetical protein